MMNVLFYPDCPVAPALLEFSVVAARTNGQWLLCKHKESETWELPGGYIEAGESAEMAAKRELHAQTGADKADIHLVGYYSADDGTALRYGALFYADVTRCQTLSSGGETCTVSLFVGLPESLTYPLIQPKLFHWVQEWLNMQSSADELWDVYDENRILTGRTHRRGDYLREGDYHLVVYIWMLNSKGQFLLTKRSPNKGFPNMWETTGGSAIAGDDSLTAAIREVQEETGFKLDPNRGERVITYQGKDYFADVWLFRQDFVLQQIQLLEGETCDAGYFSKNDILNMQNNGMMVPYRHIPELFRKIDKK